MAFTTELPGIMAVQHQVIKQIKKETGLRQRDWEVLCACYMLSMGNYPFTAMKVVEYLGGSYFLPSLYDTIRKLHQRGYIHVIIPGKPFKAEGYEFTYEGRKLVRDYCNQLRQLSDDQEFKVTGKCSKRLW